MTEDRQQSSITEICPRCQGNGVIKPDITSATMNRTLVPCDNPDCFNGRVPKKGFEEQLAYLKKVM